ncbi:DNA gyrase inhibitor YacG [Aquabacterium humicola]|uniref:DNA gyrase inhibitor YacG n=1 Tax=Aquabacterium humicola TaxID=3237377 RepID=UPI002542FA12|nr:DNA gyrase inhibitor YacG [Rubrivivax pictus]
MASTGNDPTTARRVRCPTCGAMTLFAPSNRWRPFCSERCRSVDLGAWASERYRVDVSGDRRDDGDDDPAATP